MQICKLSYSLLVTSHNYIYIYYTSNLISSQEQMLRQITLEQSKSKEMQLSIKGNFYTEQELREDKKLSEFLSCK